MDVEFILGYEIEATFLDKCALIKIGIICVKVNFD